MDGYGSRHLPSAGHHDPLSVRAVAFDDGRAQALLIVCDVIGVDSVLTAGVRQRLQEGLGVAPDLVMLAATHTHSGPAGVRISAHPLDASLRATLADTIVACAEEALTKLQPVRLAYGQATVTGLNQNRRDPSAATPARLDVLVCHGEDELPVAIVVGFACHPTVLDHGNLHYSADYPGAVVTALEAALPGAVATFVAGACAEVNPARSAPTFTEVARFGRVLGGAALRLVGELGALDAPRYVDNLRWDERLEVAQPTGRSLRMALRGVRRSVDLPLKAFASAETYEVRIAALRRELDQAGPGSTDERRRRMPELAALAAEHASRPVAAIYRERYGEHVPAELHLLLVADDLALLAFPGEAFSTYDRFARERWPGDLLIAAYTNDYVGYLVTTDCLATGGYEAGRTLYGPGQQAAVEAAVTALLGPPDDRASARREWRRYA